MQALTLEHARSLLRDSASILDAAYEVGLSGPGRLHDLFVTHEAMSPGEWKSGGEGLTLSYGFFPSQFGSALVIATERGLCGLAFADAGEEAKAFADMKSRWPRARFVEDLRTITEPIARRIFDRDTWRPDQPLKVIMIGTDFEVRVWQTLLKIPMGHASTYSDIARKVGNPKAARAVGAAVGKNPVCFVVPCHRVIGKSGDLTGYHWGLTRKRAILGWEAGQVGGGVDDVTSTHSAQSLPRALARGRVAPKASGGGCWPRMCDCRRMTPPPPFPSPFRGGMFAGAPCTALHQHPGAADAAGCASPARPD